MDMQAHRDYGQWLRKTPLEIRGHVIRAGGWAEVFPPDTTIPRWLSRVRNFFNEQPSMLTRVGEEEARFIINMIRLRRGNFLNQVLARGAFSGDVYRDQTGRHWIEQSQAGSRYHSKEQRGLLGAALTPHSMTGVFKLCSPDGTGGSSETALHNWMHGLTGRIGKRSATEVGHTINAATQAIVAEKYRGSYNFADTMVSGFDEHDRFDIIPDKKFGTKYENERRWAPLAKRIFQRFSGDGLGVGPHERG